MSTNLQIITDALQLLGVLEETETPSAEQAAHGLRRLNQMMAGWEADDIVLGYFQQSSSSAVCPIPDWAEKGVMGALALDMAPHYGRAVAPEVVKVADEGQSLILRTLMNLRLSGVDMSHLGRGGRWNILTDG